MVTVLTPTYNRAHLIEKAYQSLIKQTDDDFEWVVIDDGSQDDTKVLIERYIKENKISIRYFYKKNGGKHTALNEGMKHVNGELTLILDSDDELTDNAIALINANWPNYKDNSKICGMTFLKAYDMNRLMSKSYSEDVVIDNAIEFRYNRNTQGDMCEVYRTEVLRNYPFPVFEGERFLSEAIVWNRIAFDYDTVYINKIIYLADYLDEGLTKNILKMRYSNPVGALENANLFMDKRFKLSIRMKNAILYDGFSLIKGRTAKSIIKEANDAFLSVVFLPAGVAFKIWLKLKVVNK